MLPSAERMPLTVSFFDLLAQYRAHRAAGVSVAQRADVMAHLKRYGVNAQIGAVIAPAVAWRPAHAVAR